MRQAATTCLLLATVVGRALGGQPDAPSHGRPFFMPQAERARIQALVEKEPWARQAR
jgi:hypothetical protein